MLLAWRPLLPRRAADFHRAMLRFSRFDSFWRMGGQHTTQVAVFAFFAWQTTHDFMDVLDGQRSDGAMMVVELARRGMESLSWAVSSGGWRAVAPSRTNQPQNPWIPLCKGPTGVCNICPPQICLNIEEISDNSTNVKKL